MIARVSNVLRLLMKHKWIFLFFITVYAYLLPMLYWLYFDQSNISLTKHTFAYKSDKFYEQIVIGEPKSSCLTEFRGQYKNTTSGETILVQTSDTTVIAFEDADKTAFERELSIPKQILLNPFGWEYTLSASYTCNPVKHDLYTLDTIAVEKIINDANIILP